MTTTAALPPKLEFHASSEFANWLEILGCSIAFTTYQVGKIFMLGAGQHGQLHVSERTFPKCMGLAMQGNTLWLSSIFQIWRFENSLLPGQQFQGYDRVFVPQMAYTTGSLDVHDLVIGKDNKPVFVNTLFNCLSTVSETHSFKEVWRPPFISQLVPEDRCHLNGLAAENGHPAYVTMVYPGDFKASWRDHRSDGGILMDVRTNEVICRGLSMPHSPRIHQGKIWLLEAGTGYFGYVNEHTKAFERVAFCPGFLRGLHFMEDYAIVGHSKNRENRVFTDLELEDNLVDRGLEPTCGISIIHLPSQNTVATLTLEGIVRELFDVMILPAVSRPLIIGTHKEEVHRVISIEPTSQV